MKKSEEKYVNSKPVSQYTLDGLFVMTYNSIGDIADQYDFNKKSKRDTFIKSIKNCCEGISRSSDGHFYVYLENTWASPEDKKSLDYKVGLIIDQYSLSGDLINSYYNTGEAEDKSGLKITTAFKSFINDVLKNKKIAGRNKNSAYGYIWLYRKHKDTIKEKVLKYNEDKSNRTYNGTHKCKVSVICLGLDGILIRKYESARDSGRITGANQSDIIKCCQGKAKTAGGYKWMYEEDYNKLKK